MLIAGGAVALVLQGTGTVDLGIPMGSLGDRQQAAGAPPVLAVPDLDLGSVLSSAAALKRRTAEAANAASDEGASPAAARPLTPVAATPPARPADPIAPASEPAEDVLDPLAASVAAPLTDASPSETGVVDDGYRSEVERAWFAGGSGLSNRAQGARTRALQLGATNYEGASRAMLAAAEAGGVELESALLAVRLAPDLPMARMHLAAAYLDDGQYIGAMREVVAGVRAIPRNLEATLWLAASLLAMFAAVLTVGSLVFIVWVGVSAFRPAAHDIGDLFSRQMPGFARGALLASLLLVPVLLGEALMGVVLALFALGFTYCESGYRRALTVAAVLLVLGVYPVTRLAGMALTSLDSDPVAAAADSVARSMASGADIDILVRAGATDSLAVAALALHERRSGRSEAALARYESLLQESPMDPVVLVALSNMYFERGDNERSILLGERAAGLVRSATLLFNLSQVYARSFRMDEFEGAMAQAQLVDPDVVADLSRTKAPDFVADLSFPLTPIRDRMIQSAGGERFVNPVSRAIMPGRLGRNWMATGGGFAAAAALGLLLAGRWERASSCGRCGRRICNRCDSAVWNSQICDGCHHLFHRPETTDPSMRMARLSELRTRETLLGRVSLAASILIPGAGGLLAKRPDLSFLGLFFFAWAAVLILWRDGVVIDPLAIGSVGPLLFVTAAVLSASAYALVVGIGLMIRRSL